MNLQLESQLRQEIDSLWGMLYEDRSYIQQLEQKLFKSEAELECSLKAEKCFRKTLEWIVANPGCHPGNILAQAKSNLNKHPKENSK
jgi:hypothetical protein